MTEPVGWPTATPPATAPAKKPGLFRRRNLIIGAVLFLAVAAAGAGGNTGTTAPQVASRCVAVPAALVDAIATGLTVTDATLGPASAVKSAAYSNVYFVAVRLKTPGMDEAAVWATNSLTVGEGSIFAADGFAKEFSDWGPGPGFSITDDGATEARHCLD